MEIEIHDTETDERYIEEISKQEIEARKQQHDNIMKREQSISDKENKKKAILEKLGLTEDEANSLLS